MSFTALVVDDDTGFSRAFQAYFSDWRVEAAEDGEAAKQRLEKKVFDVVVLDRNMPKMMGNEVLRWMATRTEHQYTCTIMCTAFGQLTEAVESLKLGAWNYVSKPVRDLELLRTLLLPGIALKRCNKARSELFAAPDLQSFFDKLRAVCGYATGPAGGLHLLLVSTDGEVLHSEGTIEKRHVNRKHAFVDKIMKQGDVWLFSETEEATLALQPILPDSKTLAAVAVRGIGSQILGVLDMEAAEERAFGPGWQEVIRYIADLVAIHRVNDIRAQQLASAMIYREVRHRIATHAQVVSMQTTELLEPGATVDMRRLQIIKRNADTIDSIVRGLRDIAQEPTPIWTTGNSVLQLVKEAAEQSSAKHATTNQPTTNYRWVEPLFDCHVKADVHELKYTFECILDNAWESIAERYRQDPDCADEWRGWIDISITRADLGVAVNISDNGIGFEMREKDLLFSPLYSTKTQIVQGKERHERGVERITQVLNSLGWALSIDKDVERALNDTDLAGAEITIRDQRRKATIDIRHSSLKNGGLTVSQVVVAPRSDENRGIGLFSAKRTILRHQGLLQAESGGVFSGAMFKIWLPSQL